jgi:hypothetical protein
MSFELLRAGALHDAGLNGLVATLGALPLAPAEAGR